MHRFIYFLTLLLLIFGCSEKPKKIITKEQQYSNTQKRLFQFLDDYKADYYSATKEKREDVVARYHDNIEHFLIDSLGRYIDSMTVTVDTVVKDGWLVTTQFHSRHRV